MRILILILCCLLAGIVAAKTRTPVVAGPVSIDYTEIAAVGACKSVMSLSVNAVLLEWWSDPNTFVAFNGGAQNTVMGQGSAFDADPFADRGKLGFPDGLDVGPPPQSAGINVVAGDVYNDAGMQVSTQVKRITEGLPVRVCNNAGVVLTSGHIDLYFLYVNP